MPRRIATLRRWVGAALLIASLVGLAHGAEPLRVFLRAGPKTHGPGQHDYPRFLTEWTQGLAARGVRVEGALGFPTAAALARTDVLLIYAAEGMNIVDQARADFEAYLRRGGGVVVVHDGVMSGAEHAWAKQVQGGAWIGENQRSQRHEGEVGLYVVNRTHPIVRGLSNFDWHDEIYYRLDLAPDIEVLATSFHTVFVIAPQLWTYERTWEGGVAPYRVFVALPGHQHAVFATPQFRVLLLRGLAWAGRRADVDELCLPAELAALKYPVGGPVAPELAAQELDVHPEFELELVAAEPLVEKVISLDWDPQGRLWVAETPEYPHGRTLHRNDAPVEPARARVAARAPGLKEDRPARDRISILTDTDGDGRMDRKRVFYGGLELVTSLVLHRDGAIVAQAPDILWLRDTDADGQADRVETLYTGFGTQDTHAVINNFRWGLDGWVYGAVGYSAGHPKSGDGTRDFGRLSAGIIRFRPDGTALEQVASGSCNTWGFDFAPDGEMFYTTATCGEHLLHIVLPESALARGNVGGVRASAVIPDHQKVFPAVQHTRPAYRQIDWVGMFTAASGACVYDGGAWPERFHGLHFLTEPTVNLVHCDVLAPQGITYRATKERGREEVEFITSSDLWFRPIHVRTGPEGALYVVDWYNQAVIHNDPRGPPHGAHNAATRPDRDHHFARLWRVQHREARRLRRPALEAGDPSVWVQALFSPNGWTRQTAHRLLTEHGAGSETGALVALARGPGEPVARLHALHVLENLGQLGNPLLVAALDDPEPIVRKGALRIVAQRDNSQVVPNLAVVRARVYDADPRARLQALIALATFRTTPGVAKIVAELWSTLGDPYLQSAALGVVAADPLLFIEAAFAAPDQALLVDFVRHTTRLLADQQDATAAVALVTFLAQQPRTTDLLKRVAIESLAGTLRAQVVPEWNPELQAALARLLESRESGLPGATLPLLARWDRQGTLAAELKPVSAMLLAQLADATLPDATRGQMAMNLLGVEHLDPQIVGAVGQLLSSGSASGPLQARAIKALGTTAAPAAADQLIAAYANLTEELREAAFAQLLRRGAWAGQLLDALAQQRLAPLALGPARLHRLRTHPDDAVATRANALLEALRAPVRQEKEALIAQLLPAIQRPGGDLARGRDLFSANCAGCHRYQATGRDLAPDLTGMGAHGAADLLVHILDPNRVVEPNFLSVSVETRDDLAYDGIVARENNAELVLRNASGDYTLRKANVQSRRTGSLSLMPEGFEALGAENLRDLLAYLCADELRFRILDLTPVFTANTSYGIYSHPEAKEETLKFRRWGIVRVGEVPFDIVSPAKSPTGNNVLVLRGGAGHAQSLPQQVEVAVGLAVRRLYFLGGVGGWAWPSGGDDRKHLPVAKVTLHFADGQVEEFVLRNGVEFADYLGHSDVPGSRAVADLVQANAQVRWFSLDVAGRGTIAWLQLESYRNAVAPTFVSITAELAEPDPAAAAHSTPARAGAAPD